MLEVGETPTLCRNGKADIAKSDTAIKVSRAGANLYEVTTSAVREAWSVV